jgi:beta-phosphoglucomutase
MDGVLCDTAPFHLEAWEKFSEQQGQKITKDLFYRTFGMKNAQIFPLLFGKQFSNKKTRILSDEKELLFRSCIKGKAKPFPGVLEFIKELCKHNFVCAIGSSAPKKNVELVVKELKLGKYIKGFISGDDVLAGKPDPAIFNMAAQLCGAENANCLVVEDAVVGIQAANAAGMASVAVTNTCVSQYFKSADRIVNSMSKMNAEKTKLLILANIKRKNDSANKTHRGR